MDKLPRWTFFLATAWEWLTGLCCFVIMWLLVDRPKAQLPWLLMLCGVVTMLLTLYRILIRERSTLAQAWRDQEKARQAMWDSRLGKDDDNL